jgi:cobalamin synthase
MSEGADLMSFVNHIWQIIKSLFQFITGIGKKHDSLSSESDAVSAVFLPLVGLAIGAFSVLATAIIQLTGFYMVSVLAGLLVLAVLGGIRQYIAIGSLFTDKYRSGSTALAVVFITLFEVFVLYELGSSRGIPMLFSALLYFPVAGSLAMLSCASVTHSVNASDIPLASVKAGHMLLASVLTFVLMLPQFGLLSLLYVSASVLSGSLVSIVNRRGNRGEAIYISAAVAGILFLFILMLMNRPQIYY